MFHPLPRGRGKVEGILSMEEEGEEWNGFALRILMTWTV